MVIVKSSSNDKYSMAFARLIYVTCKNEIYLSKRSFGSIYRHYINGDFLIAVEKGKLIAFLLCKSYTNRSQELAIAFVHKNYRSRGIFTKMIRQALTYRTESVLVTFNGKLAKYLVSKFGFKEASIYRILILTSGRFLLDRLSLERLFAIGNHVKMSKPTFLLFRLNV